MRYGLQVGACQGPDFGLWVAPNRPKACLLQNSFMMLIKSMTPNNFCYEVSIAQGLSGKVACTGFGEFSVYRLKAWHRRWVSAVENAWGYILILWCIRMAPFRLCSQVLLPACSHCVCTGSLPWSLWSKWTRCLSSKPVCSIVCLKFPVQRCECIPCWNWLLLPGAVFQLCTNCQTLPCASVHITFLPIIKHPIILVLLNWKATKSNNHVLWPQTHHMESQQKLGQVIQGWKLVNTSWTGVKKSLPGSVLWRQCQQHYEVLQMASSSLKLVKIKNKKTPLNTDLKLPNHVCKFNRYFPSWQLLLKSESRNWR